MAEPGLTLTGPEALSLAVVLPLLWPVAVKLGEWAMQLRGQRVAQADSASTQLNRLIDQLQEEVARSYGRTWVMAM